MRRSLSTLPTFTLAEWQTLLLEGMTLSRADIRLKEELESGEEGRLFVDELRDGVRVSARSWVGVIRFESFEVRIVPKLAGDNLGLIEMIEFTSGLDALRRNSGARSLEAEGGGLLDLLALLLSEAADTIIQGGLLADYVEREGELPVVRGRILADQQILSRYGRLDRVHCRFDEHEQDIVENQLIAAALGRCSARVSHEYVRKRTRRALAVFQGICNSDGLDLESTRRCVTYNRLNEHYRDAHGLAWLLLDGLSTSNLLGPGETHCFAFLLDMNQLFEKLVYKLVDRLLGGMGMTVYYQRGDRSIVTNVSNNKPYARVVPDILVEPAGSKALICVAIDAKYKLYDERKIAASDVYQGFLYAFAFNRSLSESRPVSVLVYPSSSQVSSSVHLRVSSSNVPGADIHALGIRIPAVLAEVSNGVLGSESNRLIEAIRLGLCA